MLQQSRSEVVFAEQHVYVNGEVFPEHNGTQALRNPFVFRGQRYKTEEEYMLAVLLHRQGVQAYYERINFPGWVPDFMFHKPHVWSGQPFPGTRIWGIELKFVSPLRPEWIKKSVDLRKKYRIPVLVLSRANLEPYVQVGYLPLVPLQ